MLQVERAVTGAKVLVEEGDLRVQLPGVQPRCQRRVPEDELLADVRAQQRDGSVRG